MMEDGFIKIFLILFSLVVLCSGEGSGVIKCDNDMVNLLFFLRKKIIQQIS